MEVGYKYGPCGTNTYRLRLDESKVLAWREAKTRNQLVPGANSVTSRDTRNQYVPGTPGTFEGVPGTFDAPDPEPISSANRPYRPSLPSEDTASVLSPRFPEKKEIQPQPPNPTPPDRKAQDGDPPTVAAFKARVSGLAQPPRQPKPLTQAELDEQVRALRERFPGQFEKWDSRKRVAVGGAA